MPAIDDYKSSWADEVELDSGSLPPPTEITDASGQKIVTEYKFNKDDKKVKVVRTYKITKQVVSKSIARRKMLPKFGDSANDKPGPNAHTTMVSEDVNLQLITSKEEEKSSDAVLDPKSEFIMSVNHSIAFTKTYFYFQINLPSVVSVMVVILQPIVRIVILLRTLKRFWTRSQHHRHRPLKPHHRSLANTFPLSSRINNKRPAARRAMTQPLSEFPIFPNLRQMRIWKILRTNLVKSPKCIWPKTKIPACARALLTFISTIKKMLPLLLRHSMDLATII